VPGCGDRVDSCASCGGDTLRDARSRLVLASKGLNALADAGDFVKITKVINGGYNGLPERADFWERAKATFGVSAPPVVMPRARLAPVGVAKPKPAGKRAGAVGKKRAKPRVKAGKRAAPRPSTYGPKAKQRAKAPARSARARGRGATAKRASRRAAPRKSVRRKG
jgi:hypothetical protein